MLLRSSPPRGLLRVAFDAPRWLYRFHLGWLLGHHFLLLTHRGRHSGRPYRTVIEVARYDPATGESVVVSGWGERADWYRNLQAEPALQIETGRQRYRPVQRFLAPEQVYQELRGYLARYPWVTGVARRLFGLRFDGSDADQARVRLLRGVAFRPAAAEGRG